MERASRAAISPAAFGRRAFLGGAVTLGAYGAVSGALAGCSTSSAPSASATKTLAAGVFQNPDSLDPGATGLVSVAQMLSTMFDPLMWKFPNDPTYYPGLAKSYTVSSDAKTYTFKLRSGIKFHDGTPFNADAVKATFDHIVNPATKSLSAIGALGPYVETRVIDPYTVQVVFSKPNAAFVNEMTQVTLAISSPTALKKYGSSYDTHPVGTGPFKFQQFVNNEKVVVVRNPDYAWGPAAPGWRQAGAAQPDHVPDPARPLLAGRCANDERDPDRPEPQPGRRHQCREFGQEEADGALIRHALLHPAQCAEATDR